MLYIALKKYVEVKSCFICFFKVGKLVACILSLAKVVNSMFNALLKVTCVSLATLKVPKKRDPEDTFED